MEGKYTVAMSDIKPDVEPDGKCEGSLDETREESEEERYPAYDMPHVAATSEGKMGGKAASVIDIDRNSSMHAPSSDGSAGGTTEGAMGGTTGSCPVDVVNDLTEFLFDLFDAEFDEGYQHLKRFIDEHLPDFDSANGGEYSFHHEQVHRQFCDIFESLCEDFIRERGLSATQFYELVQLGMARRATEREGDDADEVVTVINSVLDFQQWAEWMRDMARNPQMRM